MAKAAFTRRGPRVDGDPGIHPIDEDLSLHPSEQKSLAGDPESMGTPVKSCPDTEQIDEIRYSVQAV